MDKHMLEGYLGGCPSFGVFVDPINLLFRLWKKSNFFQSTIKDTKIRQKLRLTLNEYNAIECFEFSITVLFTNKIKEGSRLFLVNDKTCMMDIKKIHDWHNTRNQSGLKVYEQMDICY